jgi:amidohydrolase
MARSTELAAGELLAALEGELEQAVELRRRLHGDPELSHAEVRTAELVAAELPVRARAAAGTGRLALIGAGTEGQAPVAVRAELDGLPITEQTGADFSARGTTMHACGHDVHMAALTALCRAADSLAGRLPAPLLAVFQPSEETAPSGAEMLAAEGLGEPAPRAIVSAHIHPELAWGTVALDAGAVNASFDAVEIEVRGQPTHGAYPHLGADPVLALSAVIVALHAQLGRSVDPTHPATLTVGVIEGGSADNVIPALVRARAALRAHRVQDRMRLIEMTERVVAGVASAHGCEGHVRISPGEPALENDPAIVASARELLGEAGLTAAPEWRSCGSDDFAFLSSLAPIAMAFVGLDGAPGFKARPLHHPELLPPDGAVGAVARALAVMYLGAAGVPGH